MPDLGDDAAEVLGADIVDTTRDVVRELAADDLLDLLDAEEEESQEEEEDEEGEGG